MLFLNCIEDYVAFLPIVFIFYHVSIDGLSPHGSILLNYLNFPGFVFDFLAVRP